jgi:hypothetical protein
VKINIQIERLVLDGLPVEHRQRLLVKAAVEAELGRLLAADGLTDSLMSGGAVPSTRAPGFRLASESSPTELGQQIGRAVHGGIGK